MTPTDVRSAGLDPAHILAVCTQATGGGAAHAVGTPDGVRVSLPTRKAAWDATAALDRVGYIAALAGRTGRDRDLVVTGWSSAQLDWRLSALRGVMHRLADNPLVTATAAVRRFAALPASAASPAAASGILGETRQQLQDWAETKTGIRVPAPPAVLPANAGTAVQVRAVITCEQQISDLIERHLRVAKHALALFGSLRQQMNNGRAQRAAVRRASAFFNLSPGGSIAQDSSHLMRPAAPTTGSGPSRSADSASGGVGRDGTYHGSFRPRPASRDHPPRLPRPDGLAGAGRTSPLPAPAAAADSHPRQGECRWT